MYELMWVQACNQSENGSGVFPSVPEVPDGARNVFGTGEMSNIKYLKNARPMYATEATIWVPKVPGGARKVFGTGEVNNIIYLGDGAGFRCQTTHPYHLRSIYPSLSRERVLDGWMYLTLQFPFSQMSFLKMKESKGKEIRAELIASGALKPGAGFFVTHFHNFKNTPVLGVGFLTQKQLDAPLEILGY